MVTKKTTKKSTASKVAKPAPKKAAAKPATTTTRVVSAPAKSVSSKRDNKLPDNLINIIVAEIIGTFILTLVVLVLTIGAVSGAHVNPAVTFGLWAARKLKTVLLPFYWVAQFLGAIAAVVLIGSLSGGTFTVHFDNFMEFSWGIFTLELVGTAVFLFGVTAVWARRSLKESNIALGFGLSLMAGLLVTATLLPYVQNTAVQNQQDELMAQQENADPEALVSAEQNERDYPREIYIGGATLNPAIALAATEKTDSQLRGSTTAQAEETAYSRFGMETILATLIGAAIGSNLYLLVGFRSRTEA